MQKIRKETRAISFLQYTQNVEKKNTEIRTLRIIWVYIDDTNDKIRDITESVIPACINSIGCIFVGISLDKLYGNIRR